MPRPINLPNKKTACKDRKRIENLEKKRTSGPVAHPDDRLSKSEAKLVANNTGVSLDTVKTNFNADQWEYAIKTQFAR